MNVRIASRKNKRVAVATVLDHLEFHGLCHTCRLKDVCCYKSAVMQTWERHGLMAVVYQCPDWTEKKP